MTEPSRVRVSGPLAPYAPGFAEELAAHGFAPTSAGNQLQLLAHMSRWLEAQGLGPADITEARVMEFLMARRKAGYARWLSLRGVTPVLGYLHRLGVVPEPERAGGSTPVEALVESYRRYLVAERGLAASSLPYYERVARLFLGEAATTGPEQLAELTAADVTEFVLRESRRRSVGTTKQLVTMLRSLLRFLHLQALIDQPLAAAVPAVAGWRLTGLPRGLGAAEVSALLGSCDRRTTTGRRDYAVLLLLVRLGLRAGEVAALRLDDVDWRRGQILVRGKGRREEPLPLPVDVGEVMADYLRSSRPPGWGRSLFLTVRAPYRALSSAAVSSVVRTAGRRAGLTSVGAHQLRHTAATAMLRAGAGLAEVGQVLRHRSATTTAIYAKVDRAALRQLARPWLGESA